MGTVAGLTRDGALLTLDRHLVETLRSALRGPLLAAGDPGYEEARSTLGGGFGYLELARDLGHVVTVARAGSLLEAGTPACAPPPAAMLYAQPGRGGASGVGPLDTTDRLIQITN